MPRTYRGHCEHCERFYVGDGKRFCSPSCHIASLGDLQTRWNLAVPDRPDGCWLWHGAIGGEGYGHIRDRGRQLKAHRVAYELHVGQIPDGMLVRHRCDNPPCVNPEHLVLGAAVDNNRDTRERKRFVASPGERNGQAKLTDATAAEILRRYRAGGVYQRDLAAEYGVCQQTVSDIVRGRRRDLAR